jgi:hypothetical protein
MQEIKKLQIAGKQTNAYNKMERLPVGDVDGHLFCLLVSEGVNVSTGKDEFMNGAQVVNYVTSDIVNYNGPFKGYSKITKKNEIAFGKFEGKIINTTSDDGNSVILIDATIDFFKGTGQFEKIKGSGTVKGRYLTNMIYVSEWEANIEL